MLWAVAFAIIIVALLIPVLAVALEAPLLRRRREPEVMTLPERHDPPTVELARRLLALEDEVDDLSRALGELRDEVQFMQQQHDAGGPTDRARRPSPSEP